MKRAIRPLADQPSPEEASRQSRLASWYTPGLSDALGDRLLMFDNTTSSSLELLRFKEEFSRRPAFEAALRQRVRDLQRFDHPAVARVRAVEWLSAGEGLALISNQVPGQRLSELLDRAQGPGVALDLIAQLSPVLADLHRQGHHIAHGLLTPERIVVAPGGQLVLVEHVLGSAVAALHLDADRLQSDLGIVIAPGTDGLWLDRRADILQLGFVALSLLLGRRLDPADFPERAGGWLDEVSQSDRRTAGHVHQLRDWFERALQLDGRPFQSVLQAHESLQEALDLSRPQIIAAYRSAFPRHDDDLPPPDTGRTSVFPPTAPEPVEIDTPSVAPIAIVRRSPEVAAPVQAERKKPRQIPAATWAVVTLSALVVVQTAVIVALLKNRSAPAATPPSQTATRSTGTADGVATTGLVNSTLGKATAPDQPLAPVAHEATLPPAPASGAATTGRIDVTSEPSGARVTIDGLPRGVTPLALTLDAGAHTVAVTDGRTSTTRTVTLSGGGSVSVIAALGSSGPPAGWVTLSVPLELQVLEDGSLLGTTSTPKIMLPAGKHTLELTSPAVEFATTISVDVQAGKTANATVSIPNGVLSINALPWANVFIDGRPLGTTPLANQAIPIGTHEIVWRHPQFGERRQTVVVKAKTPVRLVMDLSK